MHHEGVNKLGPLNLFFEFCYKEIHCNNTCNIAIFSICVLNESYIPREVKIK